ncbi:MAG: PDZ domain-containing protein [Planctomycetes bacterium]|nr:PDZ domain-containing protein [Planctomycetota bacterium]
MAVPLRVVPLLLVGLAAGLAADRGAPADEVGYLGVLLGPIPEQLEPHVGTAEGALIEDVAPGSPAEKAGLRRHDVVVSAAGEAVKGPEELKAKIRSRKPGDELALGLKRGATAVEVKAVLGSAKAPAEATPGEKVEGGQKAEKAEKAEKEELAPVAKKAFLGVGFAEVPAVVASHLGLAEGIGVVVGDVLKESPAAQAGIETHDVLVALDGYEVKGPADFVRLVGEKKAGDTVKLELFHKGAKRAVDVALAERPEELPPRWDVKVFPPDPHDPFGRVPYGQGPGRFRRGRVIIEGPDGRLRTWEIPDGVWKAEELARDLQKRLQGFEKDLEKEIGKVQKLFDPDELSRRIKRLTEDFDRLGGDEAWPDDASSHTVTSHVQTVRVVDGGYDITVVDRDGSRTVTVKRGDEVIADQMPCEKVETLPEEVRARVEKVAGTLKVPKRPLAAPGAGRIRA